MPKTSTTKGRRRSARADGNRPVEVTFLGGLGSIGRNMATIEVDGRVAVVDCGVLFPDAEHLGVDLILPDWRWLVARGDDIEAVFLTHGHLDHIGALPYLLRDLGRSLPVYGTKLTLAFVASILREWPDLVRPTCARSFPARPSSTRRSPSTSSRSRTPSRTGARSPS